MTKTPNGPRFYRLRTPEPVTAASVRVDVDRPDPYPVYLAVGAGRRRMSLTPDEAWALWRCLSEAVATLGAPPDYIRTDIRPARR
ncbi:hypothetical protein ACFWC6_32585 [Micromonospora chalcea]